MGYFVKQILSVCNQGARGAVTQLYMNSQYWSLLQPMSLQIEFYHARYFLLRVCSGGGGGRQGRLAGALTIDTRQRRVS